MKHDAHTFKHAGYTAQTHSAAPGEFALNVWWTNEDSAGHQAILPATDAPALALAILEAAGWPERESTSVTRTILSDLSRVVEFQERVAAEAKEQAELEAEAFKLRRAYLEGRAGFDSWNELTDAERDHWLAVARKAREMRAEK